MLRSNLCCKRNPFGSCVEDRMYGGKDGSLKTGEEAIMTAHVEVMMAYTRLVAVEVVRKGWDSFV